jgi:hypothetical protein
VTEDNLPWSERYRLAGQRWVAADGHARLLEETKTAVLSQMMKALGDMPAAHADRDVRASAAWSDHIDKMVTARTNANELKVDLEYCRLKFMEWQSENANRRVEARL